MLYPTPFRWRSGGSMKILFLSDNFPPEVNAASSRVYERACYWVKDGHEIQVLTCAPNFPFGKIYDGYKNKWAQKENMDGIEVTRVKTYMAPNKGFTLRTLDFLSYMFMAVIVGSFQAKPDVVISTSPQFFTAIGAWMLSKIKRVPFVFEIGDLWPESIKGLGLMGDSFIYKIFERIELFLYRQAIVVIAQTPSFKENLVKRGIDPNKIKVIMNAVDIKRFLPIKSKDEEIVLQYNLKDKFVLGYIGTHGLSHDLTKVIDTAKLIQDKQSDIVFLFVGEGAEKENIIQYAKKNGVRNVLFIPQQTKANIQKWWSVCDVALVHLKDLDIFKSVIPSKIFEAIALGLPVLLVAPEGEASQLIRQEGFGIHIHPQKIDLYAEKVIELSLDKKKLSEFQKASLKASKIYNRDNQAREFINTLTSKICVTSECITTKRIF